MIEQGTKRFWQASSALNLASIMVFANLYLTQPLLPKLVEQYQLSKLQASWSLTICTFTLALSLLVYASLSDALGRKRLMVYSMVGVVVSTFVLVWVEDYNSLLFWRAVQGFCLGGVPAIAVAYMGDEFSKQTMITAVGYYIAANTLGGISGRLISGFLGDEIGLSGLFLLMAVAALLTLLLFQRLLPASQHFQTSSLHIGQMLRAIVRHLRNPLLVLAYAVGSLNFMIFMNQYSYITFVLADEPFHLSTFWLGLLFLTYLTGTVASGVSGSVANRLGRSNSMGLGIAIFAFGSMLTLSASLAVIITGFLFSAIGFFLCHSLVSSWVSHAAKQNRAAASAMYLVFYYLLGSVGSFYLHPFWLWQGWLGIILGSWVILLLTFALSLWLRRYEAGLAHG